MAASVRTTAWCRRQAQTGAEKSSVLIIKRRLVDSERSERRGTKVPDRSRTGVNSGRTDGVERRKSKAYPRNGVPAASLRRSVRNRRSLKPVAKPGRDELTSRARTRGSVAVVRAGC